MYTYKYYTKFILNIVNLNQILDYKQTFPIDLGNRSEKRTLFQVNSDFWRAGGRLRIVKWTHPKYLSK